MPALRECEWEQGLPVRTEPSAVPRTEGGCFVWIMAGLKAYSCAGAASGSLFLFSVRPLLLAGMVLGGHRFFHHLGLGFCSPFDLNLMADGKTRMVVSRAGLHRLGFFASLFSFSSFPLLHLLVSSLLLEESDPRVQTREVSRARGETRRIAHRGVGLAGDEGGGSEGKKSRGGVLFFLVWFFFFFCGIIRFSPLP